MDGILQSHFIFLSLSLFSLSVDDQVVCFPHVGLGKNLPTAAQNRPKSSHADPTNLSLTGAVRTAKGSSDPARALRPRPPIKHDLLLRSPLALIIGEPRGSGVNACSNSVKC